MTGKKTNAPGTPLRRGPLTGRQAVLIGIVVRFVVVYAVLLLLWPLLGSAYGAGFRGAANFLFGGLHADCRIQYRLAEQPVVYADTEIVILNRRNRIQAARLMSPRYRGYLATATLVALVLGSPVAWRRRGSALLIGLLALCALIALRELVILLEVLSGDTPLGVFRFSPVVRSIVASVATALNHSAAGPFVMALFVWLPVTFRRSDWPRFFEAAGAVARRAPEARASRRK